MGTVVTKVKKMKPVTNGTRHQMVPRTTGLHKGRPHAGLITIKPKRSSGRNVHGRMTIFQRGGGHKRYLRNIDWKRYDKDGIPAKVKRIEYDPNRTAHIALLSYIDGEYRYILAPKGLAIGKRILSGERAEIAPGNNLSLRQIPVGTVIHCVELKPDKGAQLARSAGAYIQLLAKEGSYATLRLRSGEVRRVPVDCRATVGEVGNQAHGLRKLGKAGANRWRGKRPNVRAVAMNPVDHPLGGGEGKSAGGRTPCSPWGVPEGKKTRKNKRTQYLIIRRRRRRTDKDRR